jgi:hypothetical protein
MSKFNYYLQKETDEKYYHMNSLSYYYDKMKEMEQKVVNIYKQNKGEKGEKGDPGEKGEKGDPGEGLHIDGTFKTIEELEENGVPGKIYVINGELYYVKG